MSRYLAKDTRNDMHRLVVKIVRLAASGLKKKKIRQIRHLFANPPAGFYFLKFWRQKPAFGFASADKIWVRAELGIWGFRFSSLKS